MINPEQRTRLATLLVLAVVFGAGVVVGFVLDRGMAIAAPGVEAEGEGEAPPPERRRFIIDHLDLPQDQRAQVDSVLEHYREQLEALQEEFEEAFRPRSRELLIETRTAIRALLDDAQIAAYDSLIAERNQRISQDRDSTENRN